jgi:hypothetical protein
MSNENYECEFLYAHDDMKNYDTECTFPLSKHKECSKNDCVFKQLQTAKEEKEKLKSSEIKIYDMYHCCSNALFDDIWKYQKEQSALTNSLTQQNKQMREALDKIRSYELQSLDIDWDEYEVCCRETDYSPVISYCEAGLEGEVNDN